jgi:hypothetical protein
MNTNRANVLRSLPGYRPACTGCGSSDLDWIGCDTYSECCNEPIV